MLLSTPVTMPATARPISAATATMMTEAVTFGMSVITVSSRLLTGLVTASSPSGSSAAARTGNRMNVNTMVPTSPASPPSPSDVVRPMRSATFSEPAARSMPVTICRTMRATRKPMPNTTTAPTRFGRNPMMRDIITLTGSSNPFSSSVSSSPGSANSHTSPTPTLASICEKPGDCSRSSSPVRPHTRTIAARTSRLTPQATSTINTAPSTLGA